jgi:hypothetical protein
VKKITLNTGKEVLVDDADWPMLSGRNWYEQPPKREGNTPYAHIHVRGRNVLMHRFLLGAEDAGVVVDHIDGNGLNNQRSNLRLASRRENRFNSRKSGGFKGVYQRGSRWEAAINHGQWESLGYFSTPEEAAKAYNERIQGIAGEFASLNEVPSGEEKA